MCGLINHNRTQKLGTFLDVFFFGDTNNLYISEITQSLPAKILGFLVDEKIAETVLHCGSGTEI